MLCRPAGGLNDTLCQIETCWRYAETYGRHLVIDTAASGLLDDILRYFDPPSRSTVPVSGLAPALAEEFDAMDSVVPAALMGRVSRYSAISLGDGHNLRDEDSGVRLCFDLGRDHDAQLLVHHQFGGGALGYAAMRRMKFRPEVAAAVLSRHRDLQPGYAATHIRNTDLQTDYRSAFKAIRPFVTGRTLLVCSDDRGCIDYARRFYGDTVRVVSNANIPDTGGKTLHYNEQIDRFQANCDSLADLFWIAMSHRFFQTRTTRKTLSGYSRLAGQMAADPALLRSLVSRAADSARGGDAAWKSRLDELGGRAWQGSLAPVWRVRQSRLFAREVNSVLPYRIRGWSRMIHARLPRAT